MAWQLIYTSAPRLLEAGRTGFGTVARHRAVCGLLATSIERISQFARLPGHDPRRVIYSHRILTIGGGQFHAMSCLRDAGSDYTGRTNHIAHHVIAEEREILPLIAAGITPADVLLAMNWRSSWTEGPRFLNASEEIDLAAMTTPPSSLWEQVTGVAHGCRLPWSPAARRGCYLILPHGVDARFLFRESLHEQNEQAWRTTFTTSLEPNDAVADFRWIGMSPQSPLRTLMESSTRPIFDLQHPASLPLPPPPKSTDVAAESTPISPGPILAHSRPQQARKDVPQPAQKAPNVTSRKREAPVVSNRKTGRRSPVGLIVTWVSVAAVVAAFSLQLLAQNRNSQDIARLEQQVDATWKKYHLKLADTQNWLKQQARENSNRDVTARLISSHEECIRQIHRSLENTQTDQRITIPDRTRDDFSEMLTAHDEWMKKRASTQLPPDWKPRQPSDVEGVVNQWKDERNAWKHFADFFTREPEVDQSGREELIRLVRGVLNADARSAGASEQWQQALCDLGATTGMAETIGRQPIATSLPSQSFNRSTP